MIKIETESCKKLQRFYRFCNREFFNSQLPRTNKVTLMWSDWLFRGDGSYGIFCGKPGKRFGPFSPKRAAEICAALNKLDKNKDYDLFNVHGDGVPSIIPTPYILIASELYPFVKVWQKTLLHEMVHLYLHVKGLKQGHGRAFQKQVKRLFSMPIVQRNVF